MSFWVGARKSQGGFTLVELVVYIVVCSLAMTGVLALYQNAAAKSANALAAQRSLEAARALMEEIEALPLSECERPEALGACAGADSLEPRAGRERGSERSPFATAADYNGYWASPPRDLSGAPFPGLEGYRIEARLTPMAVGLAPASDAARIDVIVTGPSGRQTLTGYRLRRAPPKIKAALTQEAP